MRCVIVGMGLAPSRMTGGITPTIAHVPTGIVHPLPPAEDGFEKVPGKINEIRIVGTIVVVEQLHVELVFESEPFVILDQCPSLPTQSLLASIDMEADTLT